MSYASMSREPSIDARTSLINGQSLDHMDRKSLHTVPSLGPFTVLVRTCV